MGPRRYILREVSATQEKEWDQFVTNHPHGHFLQSWGWGELKASAGWHPLRLALLDGTQIVAAAHILCRGAAHLHRMRSEEHTSELQSPDHLVCRLLLEKKKKAKNKQSRIKNKQTSR